MRDDTNGGSAKRTVLVIEDDAAIGHMLVTLLGVEGYRPVLIVDGARAIEAARTEQPALITLDLSLPNVSGLEILDRLDEANGPGAASTDSATPVPIVVVSAYTQRLTPRHLERVSAVVQKPFALDVLLRSIAAAIGAGRG